MCTGANVAVGKCHASARSGAPISSELILVKISLFCSSYVDNIFRSSLALRSRIFVNSIDVTVQKIASRYGNENQFSISLLLIFKISSSPPLVPRIGLWSMVAFDAIFLATVLYSLSISLAKLYAKRNDYKIDLNQMRNQFRETHRCEVHRQK